MVSIRYFREVGELRKRKFQSRGGGGFDVGWRRLGVKETNSGLRAKRYKDSCSDLSHGFPMSTLNGCYDSSRAELTGMRFIRFSCSRYCSPAQVAPET
jgi:hypothetical protein